MNNREKIKWLQMLLAVWGFPLVPMIMIALIGTEKGVRFALPGLAWLIIGATALYLLILSWRAAYISGKKAAS